MERAPQFFKDNEGKIVIGQSPNIPITVWLLLTVASMLTAGDLSDSLAILSRMVLFAWSYLELTRGESSFRRVIGVSVLFYLVISTLL